MSSLFSWIPADGWQRLMCDCVWQSTLIAAMGWLLARLAMRQSAARAGLLLLALTACVMAPVGSLLFRSAGWGVLSQNSIARAPGRVTNAPKQFEAIDFFEQAPADQGIDNARAQAVELATFPTQPTTISSVSVEASGQSEWFEVLGIAWLIAGGILILRLGASAAAVWRLLRNSKPCDDPALRMAAVEAARRVGLAKTPGVWVCKTAKTPMIMALGAPRILVPHSCVSLTNGECKIDWAATFTHELAHVVRRDGWARLWVECITVILPLQPLTWLLRRSFYAACEEACDDWAISSGTSPVDLAATLTTWVDSRRRPPALAAIGMSTTKARLNRLLALRGTPVAKLNRTWSWLGISAALVFLASIALAQAPKQSEQPPTPNRAADDEYRNKVPRSKTNRVAASAYTIEPPDIISIEPSRMVAKTSFRIAPQDQVKIQVEGTGSYEPINGNYRVDSSGEIVIGATYGAVKVLGMTRRDAEEAVRKHLLEILKEPLVALTIDEARLESGIKGPHLVGPDGTVNLGIYGTVRVGGLTVAEAHQAIEKQLSEFFSEPQVAVDVSEYNSKVYYVIATWSGKPASILRCPITGNEAVLDALSQAKGLDGLLNVKVWISRPTSQDGSTSDIINVDITKALRGGDRLSNPQILPGDRIFIDHSVPPERDADGQSSHWESAPPVVVKTVPEAGIRDVDPNLSEISVTFSRDMRDRSWSWCHESEETFPKATGQPSYQTDKRTCVMPVKLEPGKTYTIWLNWKDGTEAQNFKDEQGHSAAPYLLVFKTKDAVPK